MSLMIVPATPAHAAPDPELTADSAGAAMFSGSGLAPGGSVENCVLLTYKQLADGSNGLGMYGVAGGTGLGDYLDLTVEVGSGGSFGDCAAFTGAAVYSGSLTNFAGAHSAAASQLLLQTLTSDRGEVSVRLRLRLRDDNRAQGKDASATFAWTLGAVAPAAAAGPTSDTSNPPAPQPTPAAVANAGGRNGPGTQDDGTTDGSAPATPDAAATGGVDPVVQGTMETANSQPDSPNGATDDAGANGNGSTTSPSASPLPEAPVGAPFATAVVPVLPDPAGELVLPDDGADRDDSRGTGIAAPGGRAVGLSLKKSSPVAQLREAIAELVTSAQEAAPAAARGGLVGLGTLPFLLLFLLVQKRLDERDPKLALAPSYQDDYLSFDDLPPRPTDRAFA